VADLECEGGNLSEGSGESVSEGLGVDVQDVNREDRAGVKDNIDGQTVRERSDVELQEESSLRSLNLVTLLDEVDGGSDFDLTLNDLGGDLEDLEKVGLSWIATSGAGGDDDIDGGDGADTSGGRDLVGEDEVSDGTEVAIGEDKADVALDLGLQVLEEVAGVLGHEILQDLLDHGVLAHENLGLATHGPTSSVHLLGSDVVDSDDETLGVRTKHARQTGVVIGLLFFGEGHLS